jgi:hypothetical protein
VHSRCRRRNGRNTRNDTLRYVQKPSSYNSYACYVAKRQVLRNEAPWGSEDVTGPAEPVWDTAAWQVYFDERAAVREYDGDLPRVEAERLALEDTATQWLCHIRRLPQIRKKAASTAVGEEQPGDSLVAVLAAGGICGCTIPAGETGRRAAEPGQHGSPAAWASSSVHPCPCRRP